MKIVDHINNTVFGPNEQDLIKYPRAEIHHQRFLQVVEVSCRVGLIGFAAFRAPIPFAIAFSVGGVLGGAYSLFVQIGRAHV